MVREGGKLCIFVVYICLLIAFNADLMVRNGVSRL